MTRGSRGPLTIEIKYRERPDTPLITYHLSVDEAHGRPVITHEWLRWKRKPYGAPFRFLENRGGEGQAVSGEVPDEEDQRVDIALSSPDLLAVNALGQFREHPRVGALRTFITGWHVSYLSADSARGQPEAGPRDDEDCHVLKAKLEAAALRRLFQLARTQAPAGGKSRIAS